MKYAAPAPVPLVRPAPDHWPMGATLWMQQRVYGGNLPLTLLRYGVIGGIYTVLVTLVVMYAVAGRGVGVRCEAAHGR